MSANVWTKRINPGQYVVGNQHGDAYTVERHFSYERPSERIWVIGHANPGLMYEPGFEFALSLRMAKQMIASWPKLGKDGLHYR